MILHNPEVRIENSNVCNAHCSICPREKLSRARMTMPNELFCRLVRQVSDMQAKIISIFGYGEPLLDKQVATKVKICTDMGLESFITTNASLLNALTTIKLLDAGLTQIRFSVHGVGKKDYERVHRGLKYEQVMANIENFIAENDRRKNRCVTMVTAIPSDRDDIDAIRQQWETAVDYLEIWEPHNWAGGRDFRTVVRKNKTCGRPWRGPMQINADGKMMVCCFDFDAQMVVGDTTKESIASILVGPAFSEIRRAHREGDLEGLPCEFCDQLNEYESSPLLYSNRDATRQMNRSSTNKFSTGG